MAELTIAVTPIAPVTRVLPRVVRAPDAGRPPMWCPRCTRTVLVERVRGVVAVDVCRECGGMWLDRGELQILIDQVGKSS